MFQPSDSSREAHQIQIRVWQQMTGSARVELAARMSSEARDVSQAGIRDRHPEYNAEQVRFALYRMILGDELFSAAWPHAALLEP